MKIRFASRLAFLFKGLHSGFVCSDGKKRLSITERVFIRVYDYFWFNIILIPFFLTLKFDLSG